MAASSAKLCAKCGAEVPDYTKHGGYCRDCQNAYMREWRKTHPLNPEQRKKDNARSYLGVYVRKGAIERQPCEECGASPAEAHHEDYDKPLEVRWLCKSHHRALHKTRGIAA